MKLKRKCSDLEARLLDDRENMIQGTLDRERREREGADAKLRGNIASKDRQLKTCENKANQMVVENKTLARKLVIRENTIADLKAKIEEITRKRDKERSRDQQKFTQMFHCNPKATSAVDSKALTAINL